MSTWGQYPYPTMENMVNSAPPTPLGAEVMRDPRAMDTMNASIGGMSAFQPQGGTLLEAELGGHDQSGPHWDMDTDGVRRQYLPPDSAYGKAGSTFMTATDEDDTMSAVGILKTILGAPFNILRAGKEGLEDAIGHPNEARRDEQDAFYEQVQMALGALDDTQKGMLGVPYDRGGIAARQAGGTEVGTGRDVGVSPVLPPRKTGIREILTGESRARRARMMGQMQAALRAKGMTLGIEQAETGIYKDRMAGWNQEMQGFKTQQEAWEVPANNQSWRDTESSKQAEHYAGAAENYAQGRQADAGAYASMARGDSIYSLLPSQIYRNTTSGDLSAKRGSLVDAQTDQTRALTPAKVAATNASAVSRAIQAKNSLDKGVATGRVETASRILNAANTEEEKRSSAAGMGIDFLPQTGPRAYLPSWAGGRDTSDAPDLGAYAKRLESEEKSDPVRADLADMVKQMAGFQPSTPAPKTNLGTETATQPGVIAGQRGATSGRVEELRKKYPTEEALRAAYATRNITYDEVISILESMDYERVR